VSWPLTCKFVARLSIHQWAAEKRIGGLACGYQVLSGQSTGNEHAARGRPTLQVRARDVVLEPHRLLLPAVSLMLAGALGDHPPEPVLICGAGLLRRDRDGRGGRACAGMAGPGVLVAVLIGVTVP